MNVDREIKLIVNQYKTLMKFITVELFSNSKYDARKAKISQAKIDLRIVKVEKFTNDWAKKYIPKVYNHEFDRADKRLKKISDNKPGKIDKKKKKNIQELIEDTIAFMHRANVSIMKMTEKYFDDLKYADKRIEKKYKKAIQLQNLVPDTTDINKAVDAVIKNVLTYKTRAWGAGKKMSIGTVGEAKKSILDWFKKNYGNINFVAIEGKDGILRHYKPDYYAQLIARTEMTRGQVQGVLDASAKWGDDLIIVSSHFGACPLCIPFEGQIYSLSGKHPFYPKALDLPPYHPNCAHGIDPITDTVAYTQDKAGLLTKQTSKAAQKALQKPTTLTKPKPKPKPKPKLEPKPVVSVSEIPEIQKHYPHGVSNEWVSKFERVQKLIYKRNALLKADPIKNKPAIDYLTNKIKIKLTEIMEGEQFVNFQGWQKVITREAGIQFIPEPRFRGALKRYTSNSDDINAVLRGTEPPIYESINKDIATLREFFKIAPKYEGPTYRGLSFETLAEYKNFIKDFKVGNNVTAKGFTSTSADNMTAYRFMERKEYKIFFEIEGVTGVDIKAWSRYGHEMEVLFDHDTIWNVISVEDKIDYLHIKVKDVLLP